MFGSRNSNNTEANKEAPSFGSPFVGLHKKNSWDKYLDTASPYNSGSESPTPTSSSSTATSSGPPSPLPLAQTPLPQLELGTTSSEDAHQYFSNMTEAAESNNCNSETKQTFRQYEKWLQQHHQRLQEREQLLLHQQSQLAAQQQYALAHASSNQQHQDEISKSLQMYAMLTAYNTGNEIPQLPQTPPKSPVEVVMQDFAGNGYVCDELSRYHQYQAAMHFANQQQQLHQATVGNNSQLLHPANISGSNNYHLNDMRNSFWNILPMHMQQPVAYPTAAAAAAVNMDYNSSNNAGNTSTNTTNVSSNKKQKRYQGKNDKFSSPKHCVFCENNNEPEAVVKSHAVRDSLGRVLCPKLRTYVCPICGASGDMAHTVKYCPQKPIITMEDAIKAESFRLAKSNFYKQQMKV